MIDTAESTPNFSAVPVVGKGKLQGKVALVLSGGGARGALEVGALKVILKKVQPDMLVGTSVGALNAAFIACGGSIEELEDLWHHMSRKMLFPRNLKFFYKFTHVDSIAKTLNLENLLGRIMKKERIEECQVPLYVNATRLSDGESIFFNRGNLINALMASAAIPPLYPPRVIDDIYYVDGGVSTSNGIKKAIELGADTIIVLDSANTKRLFNFGGIFDVTIHALSVMFRKSLVNEIEACRDKRVLLVQCPNLDVGTHDFSRTAELIRMGEIAASEVMDDLDI